MQKSYILLQDFFGIRNNLYFFGGRSTLFSMTFFFTSESVLSYNKRCTVEELRMRPPSS